MLGFINVELKQTQSALLLFLWSLSLSVSAGESYLNSPIPVDPTYSNTVVITHGLQLINDYTGQPVDWVKGGYFKNSGTEYVPGVEDQMLVSGAFNFSRFNITDFTWRDAYKCDDNSCLDDLSEGIGRQTDEYSASNGFSLAKKLLEKLDQNNQPYGGNIHLIGHSLGTHVNAFAALALTGLGRPVMQVTILDRPFGNPLISGPTDDELFKSTMPAVGVKWVDNYYGDLNDGAVGAYLRGAQLNKNLDQSHAGVHHSYQETINSLSMEGFFGSVEGGGLDPNISPQWNPSAISGKDKTTTWDGGNGHWSDTDNWNNPPSKITPTAGGISLVETNYPNNDSLFDFVNTVQIGNGIARLDTDVAIHNLHVGGGAELIIENGKSLVLNSHIDHNEGVGVSVVENTGTIRLDGNDATTQLRINGVATFRGDGIQEHSVLELSDSSQNLVWGQGSPENFLVNEVGHTIRGSGHLGAHTLGLVNGGLIEATNPDNPLYVHPNSFGLLNSGTLKASNGATLHLSGDITNIARADHVGELVAEGAHSFLDITNANIQGGGLLKTLNSAHVEINNGNLAGMSISLDGTGTVGGYNNVLENLSLSQTSTLAFLGIDRFYTPASHTLRGQVVNQGEISLQTDSTTRANLYVQGEVVLGGGGSLRLSDSDGNALSSLYTACEFGICKSSDRLVNVDNTISGSGTITASLANGGVIEATNPANTLTVTSRYYTADVNVAGPTLRSLNTGTLGARDGGHLVVGGDWDGAGGILMAQGSGATVEFSGADYINFGSFIADGATAALTNSTVTGGTLQVRNGGQLALSGGRLTGGAISLDGLGTVGGYNNVLENLSLSQTSTLAFLGIDRFYTPASHTLRGQVVNQGEISLQTDSTTRANLYVQGEVVLDGGGSLRLSDSDGNALSSAYTACEFGICKSSDRLVNVDNTISGSGTITASLANGGVIEATNPANTLTVTSRYYTADVNVAGPTLRSLNTGTLGARDGGHLVVGGDWDGAGGTIQARGAGSIAELKAANFVSAGGELFLKTADGGQLEISYSSLTGGAVSLDGLATVGGYNNMLENLSLSPTSTLAFLGINRFYTPASHTLRGQVVNQGEISLQTDSTTRANLYVQGEVVLDGGGSLRLSDSDGNALSSLYTACEFGICKSSDRLVNVDNTISGSGTITASLANGGVIEATNPGHALSVTGWLYTDPNAPGSTMRSNNTGTLDARDGGHLILGGIWDGTSGNIRAMEGSTIEISATVQGGQVQSQADGNVIFGNGSSFHSGILADNAGRVLVKDSAFVHTANSFSNSGAVEIASGGKLQVDNGGSYLQSRGTTNVNGTLSAALVDLEGGNFSGSGTIIGSLSNAAGMLSPGNSPGLLTVLGDYDQQDDGWLHIEVGGLIAPGFDYDLLSVSGNAKLGGTLEVSLFNNYEPGIDDFLAFLTAGSITGHFDHFIFPTFNGMTFDLALDANTVGLITRPVPIPGALWLFSSAIALIFRVGVRRR